MKCAKVHERCKGFRCCCCCGIEREKLPRVGWASAFKTATNHRQITARYTQTPASDIMYHSNRCATHTHTHTHWPAGARPQATHLAAAFNNVLLTVAETPRRAPPTTSFNDVTAARPPARPSATIITVPHAPINTLFAC